jgi:hypothetical protein
MILSRYRYHFWLALPIVHHATLKSLTVSYRPEPLPQRQLGTVRDGVIFVVLYSLKWYILSFKLCLFQVYFKKIPQFSIEEFNFQYHS